MRILLIDDDAFLRDMYATKFKEEGHSVDVAESGEDGIDMLKKQTFDVVLLDMVMPGISGIELLTRISAMKLPKEPVCIVLSNQGEKSDIDAAVKAGAKGYIIKAELVPSEVVMRVKALAA